MGLGKEVVSGLPMLVLPPQASIDGRIILRVFLATADGNPMRARAGADSDANLNAILCFEVCGGGGESGPHTLPVSQTL
jgi:hypothetical protein